MENNQNGINEPDNLRRAFVLFCRNTPDEQHNASVRLGCLQYYSIWVKRKRGQSVCPYCGKRTRWNVSNPTSHSAAVAQGPLLDRETAKSVANRLTEQVTPSHTAGMLPRVNQGWFNE